MPVITNKQQMLQHVQNVLRKKISGPSAAEAPERSLLEELIYAICRENSTPAEAAAAYQRLKESFVDWNEIRVSTVAEVAEVLQPLSHPGPRARRIISLLQEVFEDRYNFSLDDLQKKGLKEAAKQIARYKEGVTDYTVAWATQRCLNGHAIPLDDAALRVLHRLGIVEETSDPEQRKSIRATIEHLVTKARAPEFTDLLSLLADQWCRPTPLCSQCPLRNDCPTGIHNTTATVRKTDSRSRKTKG
jgi:endonuclease-3